MKPHYREVLSRIAGVLITLKGYRIDVDGYADDIGTPEYNLKLSQRRAKAVRDYVVQGGSMPVSCPRTGMGKPILASPGNRIKRARPTGGWKLRSWIPGWEARPLSPPIIEGREGRIPRTESRRAESRQIVRQRPGTWRRQFALGGLDSVARGQGATYPWVGRVTRRGGSVTRLCGAIVEGVTRRKRA